MKKWALLVLVIFGLFQTIQSQNTLDILTISGHYGFPQEYMDTYEDKAQENGVMVGLVLPVKLADRTYWYNSINYFYWSVTNGIVMPDEIYNPMHLHGFILQTGVYHKFNERHGIQLLFAPRLMSDLNHISGSHYQFGGTALWEVKYREGLTIGYGLMFNQELYGPYAVPLINMNWQLNDRWNLSGLLPIYSKISYRVSPSFSAGLNHFGLGSSFKIGDPAYTGDYIERRSIEVGLFGRLKLAGAIYLEGRIGYSLDRRYEQYGSDDKLSLAIPLVNFGDNRVQKNVSFGDGGYANMRLVYSIRMPQ